MIHLMVTICAIIACNITATVCGSELDDNDLQYADDRVLIVDDGDDQMDRDVDNIAADYSLEQATLDDEDDNLDGYAEIAIQANIEHNENFDGRTNGESGRYGKVKRQLPPVLDDFTWRYANTTEIRSEHVEYDYDEFKREYESRVEQTLRDQGGLNETELISQPQTQCEADRFYNKGPITVICLLGEMYGDNLQLKENAQTALIRILRFWAIAFILIIVVGWVHFGCLNILCPFSICFPEDGYEEIKRYLVLNPPGIRIRQIVPKVRTGTATIIEKDTHEATETEHYLYNNLWQTIYTV